MATALAYPQDTRAEAPVLLPMPPRAPVDRDPPRGSGTEAGEFSARDVFNALRYHMVLFVILGGLLSAAGAAAGWTLFPARYSTYAMLRVNSSVPTLLEGTQGGTSRAEFGTYLSTQAGLIKSHKIMQRALRKPEVLNLPMLQGLDDPISFLEEKVALEFSERSELLKVLMAGEDPQQITKIVNGVVDAFITEVETYKQEKQRDYDKLLKAKDSQVKSLDDLLKDYNAQFRQVAGNEAVNKTKQARMMRYLALLNQEAQVRNELSKAREMFASAVARQKEAEKVDAPTPDVAMHVDADPAVARKMADVTRIETYISNYQRTASNPDSPHMQDYARKLSRERGELEEIKRQKTELFKKAMAPKTEVEGRAMVMKLQQDVERLTIDEANIKKELPGFADLFAEEAAAAPPPERAMMEIRMKTAQELVSRQEYLAQTRKAELEASDRVTLIEKASVPQNREMKKQIAFTGLGGIAGFGLVGGLITVSELRRKRIYSSKDPVFVKLPLLGRIPEHGFVPPQAGAEPAADDAAGLAFREAIDRVKTLVLRQMNRGKMQTLLVTSPAADEGKSILAWNLAAGFARTDYRVLFIDANLYAPCIHKHLDVPLPAGLAEVLRGERSVAETAMRTPVPNLFCLAAGGADDEAHRALDKSAVQKLMIRCKADFDFIVIDSCSLSEAVDPLYLAQRVDAAVVSLRTFRSRVGEVEQACRRLKLLGTPVLGSVLTDPTLNGADV